MVTKVFMMVSDRSPAIILNAVFWLVKINKLLSKKNILFASNFLRDIEILGWCPAGPVLPHAEKVPL